MGAAGLTLGQGERPGVLSGSALWARGGSDEGMSSFPRPAVATLAGLPALPCPASAGPGLNIWVQAEPCCGSLQLSPHWALGPSPVPDAMAG